MKSCFAMRLPAMTIATAACVALAGPARSERADEPKPVEVRGSVAFAVDTNVPAVTVHGKSNVLTAHLRVRTAPYGTVLEGIEAALPVKSLETGMGLRDEHMRKYVFTAGDGRLPDLQFKSDKAVCAKGAPRQPSTCQLSGTLAIRGTARPFMIVLKLTEDGDTLRAVGDGTIALSAYGIERPSQLGVRTEDAVKLRFDMTGKVSDARAVGTTGKVR